MSLRIRTRVAISKIRMKPPDDDYPLLPPARDARETGCYALTAGYAIRRGDGKRVSAWNVRKTDGPFICPGCLSDVIHRSPWSMRRHFAHHARLSPLDTSRESRLHFACKREIFSDLSRAFPNGRWICDSRRFKGDKASGRKDRQPDIFGVIRGQPVAIEVQKSSMGIRSLIARTKDYSVMGISMLWIVPLTGPMGEDLIRPRLIERYLHAMYFGRVYYWREGMRSEVLPIHFDLATRPVTFRSNDGGSWEEAGTYDKPYKTIRRPRPARRLIPIAHLFRSKDRREFLPWGESRPIPAARLWTDTVRRWWPKPDGRFLRHHYSDVPGDFGSDS